jgi:hypothetical protein
MDLDTFLTTLYVLVDDWYKEHIESLMRRRRGGKQRMSDSEVLTVALAGQWRVGVPWQSERGLVRYMQRHGRGWFPGMLRRSAFNERVRLLWSALVKLQQVVADALQSMDDLYLCVDCEPLPSCSLAQAARHRQHWLGLSRLGHGGNNGGWFFGDQLLAVVTPSGIVTGWLLGAADLDDRWMLQAMLSGRVGQAHLQAPPHRPRDAYAERFHPPLEPQIRGLVAAGKAAHQPYVADRGFNGARWQHHWQALYQATVITVPPDNVAHPWSWDWKRWLASHRQIVDTVFARLDETFALKRLNAHSYWGQLTRVAAKMPAYNIGIFLNRLLGRPDGALATLLC